MNSRRVNSIVGFHLMVKRTFVTSIVLLLLTLAIVSAASGRLCFTRGDYMFLQEPNGRIKRLLKGYEPSISPDGQTIAFVSIKGKNLNLDSHLKLIDLRTGGVRGIPTLDPFQSLSAVWSPDGRYLAVGVVMNQKCELATVNLNSGEICVIPTNLNLSYFWLNSWGEDNSLVLNALEFVYQIALDGQIVRKLPVNDLFKDLNIASSSRFSISPDGRFLLFNGGMVPDDVGIASIYLYDLTNARLSRLTPDNLGALDPQWLASGREIIFAGYVKGRYKPKTSLPYWGIYKMSVDGKRRTLLIRAGENPSYSSG
jgi:Tol biopolymer transport system component